MLALQDETRPEVLRQAALLLEQENRRLHQRIQDLSQELARLQGRDVTAALQLELDALKELLAKREQALFGDSSEKRPRLGLPETPAELKPQRGHGPREQPQLPVVEMHHALEESCRDCPACGGHLEEIKGQHDKSDEITVVERQFVVTRHLRPRYRFQPTMGNHPGALRRTATEKLANPFPEGK